MIQPEDIKRKAINLYPQFLLAWLQGDPFFPRNIPCRKVLDEDLAIAIRSVQRLREESKAVRGFGYTVEWNEINSRKHGRNEFPQRILFENEDDFLRYIGKQQEFRIFRTAVEKVRARYPALRSWIRSNLQLFIDCSCEVDGLLHVVNYLVKHPRPGLFARELPLPVDTKFMGRNRRILGSWLDLVLPAHAIRADEEQFERRFGLRVAEPHLLIRFLDPKAQHSFGCPWPECSVPVTALADMNPRLDRVLVVENKVNLLTLPPLPGTLALGGLGNSVTDLRYVPWLQNTAIWYWGDLDTAGLTILSRMRTVLRHTRSFLMDVETLGQWKDQLALRVTEEVTIAPPHLHPSERAAFLICAKEHLRIEQERFTQAFVQEMLFKRLEEKSTEPSLDRREERFYLGT